MPRCVAICSTHSQNPLSRLTRALRPSNRCTAALPNVIPSPPFPFTGRLHMVLRVRSIRPQLHDIRPLSVFRTLNNLWTFPAHVEQRGLRFTCFWMEHPASPPASAAPGHRGAFQVFDDDGAAFLRIVVVSSSQRPYAAVPVRPAAWPPPLGLGPVARTLLSPGHERAARQPTVSSRSTAASKSQRSRTRPPIVLSDGTVIDMPRISKELVGRGIWIAWRQSLRPDRIRGQFTFPETPADRKRLSGADIGS